MKINVVSSLFIACWLLQIQVGGTLKLSITDASARLNGSVSIPRILHRVFLPQKNGKGVCNDFHSGHITSCRTVTSENNPELEEWVWGEQEIEALFTKHADVFKDHPEIKDFPEIYRKFDGWMKRQDSVRHLILFIYGGLYMDLDMACQPIDHLLENSAFVLRKMGKTNFMACQPRQELSLNVLKGIIRTAKTGIMPGDTVARNHSDQPDGSMNPIAATGEKQICQAVVDMGYSLDEDGDVHGIYPSGIQRPDWIRVVPVDGISNYRADSKYIQGRFSVNGAPVCIHRPLNSWAHERFGKVKAEETTMEERKKNLREQCKAVYEHSLYGKALLERAGIL